MSNGTRSTTQPSRPAAARPAAALSPAAARSAAPLIGTRHPPTGGAGALSGTNGAHLGTAGDAAPELNVGGTANLLFATAIAAELMHRQVYEVVKAILEETLQEVEIDASAALLLLMIGDTEASLSLIKKQGWYNKTNLPQVVNKMTTLGYITREAGDGDNRTVKIRATETGRRVAASVRAVIEQYVNRLPAVGVTPEVLAQYNEVSSMLRTFWQSVLNLIQRSGLPASARQS